MEFKMFENNPCLFGFSQWYLHFQLLLSVIYPVEWIEFNEIMGKSFGELVEMIQMLPILYGILGVSHWMRRHQHFKLYEFVGNSVVSYSLESGGPCRRWFVFGLDWSQVGKRNVYWNILKNCKLTWKVGSQKYFTTDIESMTEWSKCIQMSLSSTSDTGTTSLKTSCFILKNPTIASPTISREATLSPIIMEVENGCIWKVNAIGGTHFPLPWLWKGG